jgi:20S proteasome alpha/beta subunit
MTLLLGLRCRDGVVLAADSQRTEGALRQPVPKLFTSPSGVIWGTAGSIAIQQELYAAINALSLTRNPGRQEARDAIVEAVVAARTRATSAIEAPSPAAEAVDGVFAWYSAADERTYLLRVLWSGHAEFARQYTAVGGPSQLAQFALSRSEHLVYATLPVEAAKMIVFNAADDVIRAAASGVAPPVQIAVVTASEATVMSTVEVRALEDTLAAFREHQAAFLVREEPPGPPGDTGVRP